MTDEQINEAITQATGLWDYPYSSETKRMYDFCADLNAMHEAEKTLDEDCRNGFRLELLNVTNSKYFGDFKHIHATARERAEAFLRTVGKWEEVQK